MAQTCCALLQCIGQPMRTTISSIFKLFYCMTLFWELPAVPRSSVESQKQDEHTPLLFHVPTWTAKAGNQSSKYPSRAATKRTLIESQTTYRVGAWAELGCKVANRYRKSRRVNAVKTEAPI